MNMKTIEDVFIHLTFRYLQRRKTINPGTGKTRRATSNEKISQAFSCAPRRKTHGQIERIDQVVESESNLKN